MNILIATPLYPPDPGGPATYTKLVEEELPKHGHSVEVVNFGDHRHLPKGLSHLSFLVEVLKKGFGKDLIYAQDTVSVGFPSWAVSFVLRKKFFVRVPGNHAWEQSVKRFGVKDSHDDFEKNKYGFKVEFLRFFQRFVSNQADRLIVPSKYFKEIVSRWVKDPSKVEVIYNGVTAEEVFDSKDDLRKKLNLKLGEKVMVSVGRLVPWKGFLELVEIMEGLPYYQLVILGDGPEFKNLENKVKELNLSSRVLLPGKVSRKEVFEYYKASDIFVLNTSWESFSFQVVEAMLAGVPVVTTNVSNLSEIVENDKEGLIVEPNNEEQLVEAVKKLEDESLRQTLVRAAKEKAQNFSIKNTVESLDLLFQKI